MKINIAKITNNIYYYLILLKLIINITYRKYLAGILLFILIIMPSIGISFLCEYLTVISILVILFLSLSISNGILNIIIYNNINKKQNIIILSVLIILFGYIISSIFASILAYLFEFSSNVYNLMTRLIIWGVIAHLILLLSVIFKDPFIGKAFLLVIIILEALTIYTNYPGLCNIGNQYSWYLWILYGIILIFIFNYILNKINKIINNIILYNIIIYYFILFIFIKTYSLYYDIQYYDLLLIAITIASATGFITGLTTYFKEFFNEKEYLKHATYSIFLFAPIIFIFFYIILINIFILELIIYSLFYILFSIYLSIFMNKIHRVNYATRNYYIIFTVLILIILFIFSYILLGDYI